MVPDDVTLGPACALCWALADVLRLGAICSCSLLQFNGSGHQLARDGHRQQWRAGADGGSSASFVNATR